MIQWNEYYMMGIEDFDNDHKQLFKIADRIINMVNQSMGDSNTRLHIMREGIKYLRSYFDNHALREEAYMRRIGYADYAMHKNLHDEFQQIQLVKYEKLIEDGNCSKDDILDFVGTGIGWLLEHITTADMAIVGKGFLSKPKVHNTINPEILEEEINHLFVATLNMDIHARIIKDDYQGESFGQGVYQMLTYRRGQNTISVMAGIENKFLLSVANMVYGDEIDQADALIVSTFEIFSANFWRTLATRFTFHDDNLQFKENHFMTQKQLQQHFEKEQVISVLFESDKGKFFLASDDRFLKQNYATKEPVPV